MKRTLVALVATLVLIGAQRPIAAQTSGFDPSSGYGYLPDGYNRTAAAQMRMPPGGPPGPGAAPNPAMMPSPTPMPDYSAAPVEGQVFGPGCSGVGWQVIGEYLYLRPTSGAVTYAQVVDGTNIDLPVGRTGVTNNFYDPGFRVSGARALGDCASIGVSYTYFDTTVSNTLLATDNPQGLFPPDTQVRSFVFHPNAPGVDTLVGDTAQATQSIRFQLGDIDYKTAIMSGPRYCLNMLVGARFASLDQHFDSSLSTSAAFSELMFTNVKFDGGGVRFGLEGERQSPSTGFIVYGKGAASFVGGTFRAEFSEYNSTTPFVADAAWKSNRIMTMLDFEVGGGWASEDGTIRVTAGYMVSGWYNAIKPANYIRAVQTGDYHILDSPTENVLAFDGIVFRVEWRF
jgi:hypothetical protein